MHCAAFAAQCAYSNISQHHPIWCKTLYGSLYNPSFQHYGDYSNLLFAEDYWSKHMWGNYYRDKIYKLLISNHAR